MSLQRDMGAPGVRFERIDGQIMWSRVVDASTSQGPRLATEADVKAWPFEFNQFSALDMDRMREELAQAEPPAKPSRKTRGPNKPKLPADE
jgi:hypothetical protein